jgi:hypothetical protein
VDNDIMTPDASGISRREMLVGAGILAAGYGVGQLLTGATPAYALPASSFVPGTTGLPWPSWDAAELEAAARLAAIRSHNRFYAGGG